MYAAAWLAAWSTTSLLCLPMPGVQPPHESSALLLPLAVVQLQRRHHASHNAVVFKASRAWQLCTLGRSHQRMWLWRLHTSICLEPPHSTKMSCRSQVASEHQSPFAHPPQRCRTGFPKVVPLPYNAERSRTCSADLGVDAALACRRSTVHSAPNALPGRQVTCLPPH
jgi:hypothetical protein